MKRNQERWAVEKAAQKGRCGGRARENVCVLFVHAHCLYFLTLCTCVCVRSQKTLSLEACLHVAVIQGAPVSFYSRRMGIIYTCSQGHSPHIYYTSLTGATGSQDALLTIRDLEPAGECVDEKGTGKLSENFSPLNGNADFINTSMLFLQFRSSFQSVIITLCSAC